MTGWLARAIVRLSAPLAPRELRARWREEWLGELGSHFEVRTSKFDVLRRSLGAPIDALAARAMSIRRALRSGVAGGRTDLVHTARHLWRSPRHALAVIGSLTIGLAVSVMVFSSVNALLYGAIPGIEDRQTLARFFISHEGVFGVEGFGRAGQMAASPLSLSDFDALEADDGPAFAGVAAEGLRPVALTLDALSTGTTAAFVSRDYFRVLGTRPVQGRFFEDADYRSEAPPVAVIGFHLWRDRFGAPADIVGRSLLVAGRDVTIVGVAPPRFTGVQPNEPGTSPLDYVQLWAPLSFLPSLPGAPARTQPWLTTLGRLTSGVSREQARASLDVAAARVSTAQPETRKGATFLIRAHGFGPDDSPLNVLVMIGLVLAIPLSVLAIACANVASLQLARATERARELSVRLALGASRSQLLRLLCLDTAILAVLATTVGWLGAAIAVAAVRDVFPVSIGLDLRVLLFAVALAAAVIVLSGIAPAWLVLRRRATADLRPTSNAAGPAHPRLRSGLVVMQIAVSLVLLSASVLFIRSVQALRAGVPDSLRDQLVTNIDLETLGYSAAQARAFLESVQARLAVDPRIRASGATLDRSLRYKLPGRAPGEWPFATGRYVTESWLSATDIRLRSGRMATAPAEAVISERLARDIAPDGSALGRSLEITTSSDPVVGADDRLRVRRSDDTGATSPRAVTVVGVVADVKWRADERRPESVIYELMPVETPRRFQLRLRAADPPAVAGDLWRTVRSLEPRLAWAEVETGDSVYLREVGMIGYLGLSIGGLGTIGLVLAAGGLYAVMAYLVAARRREIGVRLAIGARPADVVGLVFRQAMRLAVLGVMIGLAIAVPMAIVIRGAFVDIAAADPISWLPPILVSLAVAAIAGAWPASRAAQIDPARTLRDE